MTQTEKNCTNCYWHNNGCPSTGEVCNGLSMWKPKACDYWNGEECTFDHSACDSQVESQLSQKEKELGEYKEALRLACMEIKKSCDNCVHNVSPMCTRKVCGICDATSLKLWRPDYQTLEAELQQEQAAIKILQDNLKDETDYSHKIQSLIFSRYAELFTNYTFIDHETAIDLMAGEILTLRKELQQHKEALRLACEDLRAWRYCGDEVCLITTDDIVNDFLEKAKGGKK